MPYVFKSRGSPVVVVRTYMCDDCDQEFTYNHHSRDEPAPDCPFCAAALKTIPGTFAIGTIKGKAVDMAYEIAEQDYGMTDMNDNSREGDVAFKGPSTMQSAEREEIVRQIKDTLGPETCPEHLVPQVDEFWKNKGQAAPLSPEAAAKHQAAVQAAHANASAARASGEDPMELLHKAKPKMRLQPLARQKVKGGRLVN